MSHKILVVEDETSILQTVQAYLQRDGHIVYTAQDGPTGLKTARTLRPDLVVLDIMLPGMDGLEVLRQLRQDSDVYVLMLTARGDESDKIVGLTVGADDYLTKPFSPRELAARVKAILRRGRNADAREPALVFRRLRVDAEARQVARDGLQVDLTTIEFDLLYALAEQPGFISIDATAEATGLPDASVDLVTAGQAFHWFEAEAARAEFRRILRPGGGAALIWNGRDKSAGGFVDDYEALLAEYATQYQRVRHGSRMEKIVALFADGFEMRVFDHARVFDVRSHAVAAHAHTHTHTRDSLTHSPTDRQATRPFLSSFNLLLSKDTNPILTKQSR